MFADLKQRLDAIVWGPQLPQHGLPGRTLAVVLRYSYAVLRDVFSGQLTLRAMSLVYTTLLSIVPLLAFSFTLLKGYSMHEWAAEQMYTVLEPLGASGREFTDNLLGVVNAVNIRALVGFGLVFFIYAAISMVQKIEASFNYVWYVDKPRSFARRFVEYISVLSVGGLLILVALTMISALQSAALVEYLVNNTVFGPPIAAAGKLLPYAIVCAVFTFLYVIVPNTQVRFSSALIGGVAGGIMWATASVIFATFVADSVRSNAVYAGFAVPISLLIWVYLNWLILLIGSQIAFYTQNHAYLKIGRREPRLSNAMRERLALNLMLLVGREFREPKDGLTLNSLSDTLRIPSITLAPMVKGLEDEGLLVSTEKDHLKPGREMSRIRLSDILAVVRIEGETGSHRTPKWSDEIEAIGAQMDDAVSETVGEMSLSDLLDKESAHQREEE